MINAYNIGKRIRILRKKKGVTQEKMAEDLGMYQADISNLERAMGGSGINDLFKLDQIADYFGVTLAQLLNGLEDLGCVVTSENKKSKEYAMDDFAIKSVRHIVEGWFISELELVAPNKSNTFFSFIDNDEPHFYKSSCSIYSQLVEACENAKNLEEFNGYCFLSGEDYIDVFQKVKPEDIGICRYLIFVATEDEDSVKELVSKTTNKAIKDIEIPIPSKEPEDLFYVNYSDLAVVYRYRLMVEENLKNPSVYSDVDNNVKREKAILEKLKAACASEEAYKVWRKDLIDAKAKEVSEKQKIVACTYIFAGMGEYKEIMPEEMVDSFKCWINHNGSAIFVESKPATKREIRTYVSQHIADELLGIDASVD